MEEFLCAAALEVERAAEGGGDGLEAISSEHADDEADGHRQFNEDCECIEGLAVPLGDAYIAAFFGVLHYFVQERANGVDPRSSGQVEVVIVGPAPGRDDCYDRLGEGLMPCLVFVDELLEVVSLFGRGDRLELLDSLLHGGLGVVIGLEETRVGRDLVTAKASFFVNHKLLDPGSQSDSAVRLFDQADGGIRSPNLRDEHAREDDASGNRKNHDLPEGSFESL